MRTSKFISTIDSHTAGEGTRLVMSGLPPIPGGTMAEKLAYADEHLSWVLGLLLSEPRGHKDLFGAILVPPCSPTADIGVLFMDNKDYEPMCGHAVIGIVTTLLETGMFEMVAPETLVTLDTPSGPVRAHAQIMDGHVQAVSFQNVPSFIYRSDVTLKVPEVGDLVVDVVFGGLFFVFVNARHLEIELIPDNVARLADLGMRILAAANEQVSVQHPELPHIDKIIDLRFYLEPASDGADSRNVVILGDHMIDRSPCGTGTCAELALRYARGQLGLGEPFVTESILGTRFTGQVITESQVGSDSEVIPAVIPMVTGSAYITGFHQFVLDGEDPFPEGFRLTA
ncbi:MAG TPA: proline racemase [Dehalococcoidia bacterium]|nr:proline racemase [Dehalococcoidia bacterium]